MKKHSNNRFFYSLCVLCYCFSCAVPSYGADLQDLATPETINTQLVTRDTKTEPYSITGESLVQLVNSMVNFDIAGSSIVFNRPTGQLIIKNTPDNHARVEEILADLRGAISKQVEIEARIITVSADDIDALGLEAFDTENSVDFKSNNKGSFSFGNDATTEIPFPDVTQRTSTNYFGQEFAIGIGSKHFGAGTFIDALKSKAEVNTVAEPRLTVFNNQRAHITISSVERFVSEVDAEVRASTNLVANSLYYTTDVITRNAPSGTTLDVVPTINNNGTITLALHPVYLRADMSNTTTIESVSYANSSLASNVLTLPIFTQQSVDTNVVIPDGGTAVIGGLIDEVETLAHHDVPILSKIPLVGRLFTNKNNRTEKSYLIMFIKATSVITQQ